MTHDANIATLAAPLLLPEVSGDASVPEWIQIFPAGTVKAYDGRGPWRIANAGAVIAASYGLSRKIHIDENHSTETAAKEGLPAPARGYVVEMDAREDGIWGRVEWTAAGRKLMEDKAYWGISPVFSFTDEGEVLRIKNVALTNDPALRELVALNSSKMGTGMNFLQKVAEALGLKADADEEAVFEALSARLNDDTPSEEQAALTAEMGNVRKALGLSEDASATEMLAVATSLKASSDGGAEQIAALQAKVTSLEEAGTRRAAEEFVDKAMAEKRVGINAATRETYVKLHMENPARAQEMVSGLPTLGESHATDLPPGERFAALSAEQKQVADAMGLAHDTYLAQLKADAEAREAR